MEFRTEGDSVCKLGGNKEKGSLVTLGESWIRYVLRIMTRYQEKLFNRGESGGINDKSNILPYSKF